jgi:uroporphyrinogen-III synthase
VAELPLQGRRVVVTRPEAQAGPLAEELERLGATPLVVPLIEIEPAEDLEAALDDDERFDWLVVTSANAVGAALPPLPDDVRVAAVGPVTAAALCALGIEPAFVPERFAADAIVDGLGSLEDKRVLLLQSDLASDQLAGELRERGAAVTALRAYRTVPVERPADELAALRTADAVVLASGSAARSLAAQGGAGEALVVCIGPQTAGVAREAGLRVGLVAPEATAEGIIQALVAHFGESRQ